MKKLVILLLTVSFVFSANQLSNNAIQEKLNLLKAVVNAEGMINEDLHKEFWKGIPRFSTKEQEWLDTTVLLAFELQRETWNCVLISIKTNKIYKSKKLNQLILDMKQAYRLNPKMLEASLAGIDTVLSAAVNKTPISKNGNAVYITEELTQDVISGLDAGIERAKILLTKEWPPPVKERILGDGLKVLWMFPYTRKSEQITTQNGTFNTINYSSTIGRDGFISITETESNVNNTTKCIEGIASNLGTLNPQIISKPYQHFNSSEASLIMKDTEDTYYINAKCIDTKQRLYSILVLSTSVINSSVYFDDLLKKMIFTK